VLNQFENSAAVVSKVATQIFDLHNQGYAQLVQQSTQRLNQLRQPQVTPNFANDLLSLNAFITTKDEEETLFKVEEHSEYCEELTQNLMKNSKEIRVASLRVLSQKFHALDYKQAKQDDEESGEEEKD